MVLRRTICIFCTVRVPLCVSAHGQPPTLCFEELIKVACPVVAKVLVAIRGVFNFLRDGDVGGNDVVGEFVM